jgi:glycosyltransferase involved in cell wall biosynthesis
MPPIAFGSDCICTLPEDAMEFPAAILENIKNKETVLFIGSGFSISAGVPSSGSLASLLKSRLPGRYRPEESALDQIAEEFEKEFGRGRLVSEVCSFLQSLHLSDSSITHRLLASLIKHGFIRTIITTNYDTLIEDTCSVLGVPLTVVAHESQLHEAARHDTCVLFKIHGDFFHPELLVLTKRDLISWKFRAELQPILNEIKTIFAKCPILFVGYSLSDYTVLELLLGTGPSTQNAPRHKRIAAIYSKDDLETAVRGLGAYGVEAFHCPDVESLFRWVLLGLPVRLLIKHVVFNYASWYPDQQARYGGIETFIGYLKEHKGDLITHDDGSVYKSNMIDPYPSQWAQTSAPTYPASFYFLRAAARASLMELKARSRVPDVIHVHFLAFADLYEESGMPTLCTSHSLISRDLGYTRGLFDGHGTPQAKSEVNAAYEAETYAAKSSHFVTVLSASHESEVRAVGARSVRQIAVPFDPGYFLPEGNDTARMRAQIDHRFTITYVGRPDRRKGIEVLIDACSEIASRGCSFQLLIVGYGFRFGSGDSLTFGSQRYGFDVSKLKQHGIRIFLKEAYDSKRASLFYSASDVIVVPSLYEPMGYVVLEAMAAARPVIASRTGGIVELLRDGVDGVLFEPGNSGELADQLQRLYMDEDLRVRLGKSAREAIERRPSAQEAVDEWNKLYQHVAFSFGESLFPPEEIIVEVRERIRKFNYMFNYRESVDLYDAAVLGCRVATDIMAEHVELFELPRGVPLDSALIHSIAMELERELRNRGKTVPFSSSKLREMMTDLTMAFLCRDQTKTPLILESKKTQLQLDQQWHSWAVEK